jgi:hypothetical protein
MLTSIQIDDKLLNEAKRIGDHQTEWETVNNALREYVRQRRSFPGKFLSDFNTHPKSDEMERGAVSPDELLRGLRNSVTEYREPTEPVGLDDWEALR